MGYLEWYSSKATPTISASFASSHHVLYSMPEERAKHSQIRQDAKSMQRGEVLTNNNININHPGQRTKKNVEVPLAECKNSDLLLRAYLLAWETGRRPVVMNGAKVLGHVTPERRPAGSESEARHVLGIAAFLPGSALSDGTSSCSPLSLSRPARRPCEPRARCDREIIPLPASKTNGLDTSPCRCAAALFYQAVGDKKKNEYLQI